MWANRSKWTDAGLLSVDGVIEIFNINLHGYVSVHSVSLQEPGDGNLFSRR